MRFYNRAYDDRRSDFDRLWEFLIEDYEVRKERFIWTVGRLSDWKYGIWNEKKYFSNFFRNNAQLWLNNLDEIIGFVISENGDSYFNVFAKRGHEFLYSEMLQWVKTNWNDRSGELTTDSHEDHHILNNVLKQEGFQERHLSAITRQYHVKKYADEDVMLQEDYIIQNMLEFPDLRGKIKLGIDAWSNGKRTEEISTLDWLQYEYNRESPCYYPDLDLSVVDREGQHLASCVAFVDYRNNYAEIEKVCTHSEHRRKGLAEALIRECLKRLHRKGIEHAYLTGLGPETQNLYGKLGAAKKIKLSCYALVKKDS